ncbi:hypothetical protein [Sphingomonas daechungensis]|nr:hypothetical protein [Sphingomonas daechungensis]
MPFRELNDEAGLGKRIERGLHVVRRANQLIDPPSARSAGVATA